MSAHIHPRKWTRADLRNRKEIAYNGQSGDGFGFTLAIQLNSKGLIEAAAPHAMRLRDDGINELKVAQIWKTALVSLRISKSPKSPSLSLCLLRRELLRQSVPSQFSRSSNVGGNMNRTVMLVTTAERPDVQSPVNGKIFWPALLQASTYRIRHHSHSQSALTSWITAARSRG